MMPRREFSKAVKVEIVKRATRVNEHGLRVVHCEECQLPVKVWHIDHTNPDALQIDKTKQLTAADGKVLCAGSRDTCHGKKTAEIDNPNIAKAKRREAKNLGIRKRIVPAAQIKGAPMPTTARAAKRAERGHRPPVERKRGLYGDLTPTGSARA